MESRKTIFVTGITGNQGGAVARSLISKGFKVKGLTRNPLSPKAQALKNINVDVVKGDLNDVVTYRKYLKNADAVFSVQTFANGVKKEIAQGLDLASIAKQFNISHFIYSSVVGADANTGIPHWESKFKIENHIKDLGLPYTIIRPASLYENYLIPQVRTRLVKGRLVSPVYKDRVQQFISAEDIGKISTEIFMNTEKYTGRTINIASEEMDLQIAANIFSEVLDKPVNYSHLPAIITRLVMGKDLYKMFKWINEHNAVFVKDISAVKKEFPFLMSLRDWIKSRMDAFNK